MKSIFTLVLVFLAWGQLRAQTGGYRVGEPIENFTLPLTGNDKVVVVVFTNKLCPYSRLYENRLQQIAAQYTSQGAKFLFVSPAIGMEQGETAGSASSANIPYIADNDQKVSKQFGATKTPEVFVLQRQNSALILRYKGAIDDNPQLETAVKTAYLKQALDAVLAYQTPAVTLKRATGCTIRSL